MATDFKHYLITIGKYPLLTPEQEIELGRRYKDTQDEDAREALINSNLRLVVYIAKNYKCNSLTLEDLVMEGNSGLMTAIDKYDVDKLNPVTGMPYRFSTCATPWIKQAISKAITDQSKSVRLPAHIYQLLSKMRKAIDSLSEKGNDDPTNAEIAAEMGIDEEKVENLKSWKQDAISLSTKLGDESEDTLEDIVGDEEDESPVEYTERRINADLVNKMLAGLPERTAIIMKMRYGIRGENDPEEFAIEHTLEEIGAYLGITRERVRQIEKETLTKLKMSYCK